MKLEFAGQLSISTDEVLRYLRSHNDDGILIEDIERSCKTLIHVTRPAAAAVQYELKKKRGGLYCGPIKLAGESIARHLEGCTHCIALAVTLGFEVDRLIATLGQTDPYRALLVDSCATAAVENLADRATRLARKTFCPDKRITFRFSPGYGDMPLGTQPKLLDAIEARKLLGLTASSSMILSPIKSVTAFIGVFDEECADEPKAHDCSQCFMNDTCPYSKQITKG